MTEEEQKDALVRVKVSPEYQLGRVLRQIDMKSVAWVLFGFATVIGALAYLSSLSSPHFIKPTVWDMLTDTLLAIPLTFMVEAIIFGAIEKFKALKSLLFPGKDEAEIAEDIIEATHHTILQNNDLSLNILVASCHLSLAIRGLGRILTFGIIFYAILQAIGPLAQAL